MKIGIIVPNIGMSQDQLEERYAFLKSVCERDTEIFMIKNDNCPVSIESEFEHEEAGVEIVKTMMTLRNADFDAFIPWHGCDRIDLHEPFRHGGPSQG